MDPYADAFIKSRSSVLQLIHDLSDGESEQISRFTLQWRVRDVVAHLCGVSEDAMAEPSDGRR